MRLAFALIITLTIGGMLLADDPSSPRPIPVTRPEMKRLLEEMKQRKPRSPLPELTAEEKAKLGERGGGYEARLRSLYLQGQGSGAAEPAALALQVQRPQPGFVTAAALAEFRFFLCREFGQRAARLALFHFLKEALHLWSRHRNRPGTRWIVGEQHTPDRQRDNQSECQTHG